MAHSTREDCIATDERFGHTSVLIDGRWHILTDLGESGLHLPDCLSIVTEDEAHTLALALMRWASRRSLARWNDRPDA